MVGVGGVMRGAESGSSASAETGDEGVGVTEVVAAFHKMETRPGAPSTASLSARHFLSPGAYPLNPSRAVAMGVLPWLSLLLVLAPWPSSNLTLSSAGRLFTARRRVWEIYRRRPLYRYRLPGQAGTAPSVCWNGPQQLNSKR